MENPFILVLIAGSLLGSGVMLYAFKRGREAQADHEAFAQSHGWTYNYTPASSRRASKTEFRVPNDDWSLQLIAGGSGSNHRIEWHTPRGKLPSGEAVLGMPLPEKSVMMMRSGGAMGKQILKAALKATIHALGKTRFDLKIDEATAGDPGGVVMASEGHAPAMDALRRNADLARYRKAHRTADVPVIIRDEDGLKLRRAGRVKDQTELIDLVALGKSLREDVI